MSRAPTITKSEPITLERGITADPRFAAWAKGKRGPLLLAGAAGTGKAMAAQAIARRLGLELVRIDLGAVVSKYVTQTEKNLDAVFDAAERGGAVLFFDEADALFGKRGTVQDAHDRYANIEATYLLQRIEAYDGPVILTTNKRANLDPAFLRRLRHVVVWPPA